MLSCRASKTNSTCATPSTTYLCLPSKVPGPKRPYMTDDPGIIRIDVPFPRLDAAAAPELRKQLEGGPHEGHERVMLDLSAVEFIDSTGLGVLVSLLKQMASGGRIAVVGA